MSQLISLYKKLKQAYKGFEIVDVSLDRDEEVWKDYNAFIPWISLPFNDMRRAHIVKMLDINPYCKNIIIIIINSLHMLRRDNDSNLCVYLSLLNC